MFRLNGVVRPGGALRFIGGSFATVLPELGQRGAFLLHLLGGGQGEFQHRRGERGEHLRAHKGL